MKISYNWLKNYAGFAEDPEALSVLLTDCGLEVESLEKVESIKGGLKGVVTGRVLECVNHPDAERLTLTRVDVGHDTILDIVCGAPNVAIGQKVFVATVGTTLYTPEGEMPIRKVKIRGRVSEGMICAEDELGLGSSHEGIMVLPDSTPVGMSAADLLRLEEDWVFEIGLTPNRIDAASHLGVARDVVAVLNHQHREKKYKLLMPDVSGFRSDNQDLHIPVFIEDEDACQRYCGISISGLKVEDSPQWLKNRLKSIGQKPINNVVDVTNFVLHELGQPLHAFDISKIEGRQVIVRKPSAGTRFVTLDNEELTLTGDDLMICNVSKPMCMAGILGGIDSGVNHQTTKVFLESACFSPGTIRRASNYHGLKTDASFRFERGTDPGMAPIALKRAAMMIKEIAGGCISSEMVDVFPGKKDTVKIHFSYHTIDRLIGKQIPHQEIMNILPDLDFIIKEQKPAYLLLEAPAYRVDVTREADVVEEVLRIYGYNNIELPEKLHSSLVLSPKPDKEKLQNIISDQLVSQGFFEIMNNSLSKGAYYEGEGYSDLHSVNILNPISQDLNVLRQTLLFGGLETIAFNQNRRNQDMKLFEFGKVYQKKPTVVDSKDPLEAYHERMILALLLTGRAQPETWSANETEVGFFDLKNAASNVLIRLGIPLSLFSLESRSKEAEYDYRQRMLLNGTEMISMGKLSGEILKRFDIKQEVFYGMIEWEQLLPQTSFRPVLYREITKYPEVRRDLALLIDKEVEFADIERLAYETERKRLRRVGLFDVYQDNKLGDGKKSYAISFVLQDEQKTLTDKEIDQIMMKLSGVFSERLGATIR